VSEQGPHWGGHSAPTEEKQIEPTDKAEKHERSDCILVPDKNESIVGPRSHQIPCLILWTYVTHAVYVVIMGPHPLYELIFLQIVDAYCTIGCSSQRFPYGTENNEVGDRANDARAGSRCLSSAERARDQIPDDRNWFSHAPKKLKVGCSPALKKKRP